MQEKLTITRVGQEKEVKTKFGLAKKTEVLFKEYPEIWHDVWMTGLQVGQVLEGERKSREYEGKTYWSFQLPKKADVSNEKLEQILTKLGKLQFTVDNMYAFIHHNSKENEIDYPKSTGEPNFDPNKTGTEGIDPESIPF